MTNKKYYISLFLIMILTIGMLSLSFSKKTETQLSYTINESIKDNSRIIYSNTNIINLNNKETDISIINNLNEPQKYYLTITNLIGANEEVVINNELHNIRNEYSIELNASGKVGDHTSINIKLADTEAYMINVTTKSVNNLHNLIINDKEVYKDQDKDYRYYGINPNNYIQYNNELFRIIGLINNKVKIVSNSTIRKNYNSEVEYPTLNDYLKSFNNEEVNINNTINYSTWLNQENSFWLNDKDENNMIYFASKYRGIGKNASYIVNAERQIIYLNPQAVINKGTGSLEEPYEVTI